MQHSILKFWSSSPVKRHRKNGCKIRLNLSWFLMTFCRNLEKSAPDSWLISRWISPDFCQIVKTLQTQFSGNFLQKYGEIWSLFWVDFSRLCRSNLGKSDPFFVDFSKLFVEIRKIWPSFGGTFLMFCRNQEKSGAIHTVILSTSCKNQEFSDYYSRLISRQKQWKFPTLSINVLDFM